MLASTCFIRDSQRYPDKYRLQHILALGPAWYPGWDTTLAGGSLSRPRICPALSRPTVWILVGISFTIRAWPAPRVSI